MSEQRLNGSLRLAPNGKRQWDTLPMGGRDPLGNRLGVNSFFLTRNDKPLFLISGEFHYARYPAAYWEQELLKMKVGGVNTVASYVFWMFHEERKGRFDWRGDKDLRHFIELCARHDLNYVLRIGPFSHGEWRNGGLPDWLYGQPFRVRSNDPRYLALVERFYTEIAAQVQGLFFSDGGPIIAVQVENEYMHAGAPWEIDPLGAVEWIPQGHEGAEHLAALKQIAERVGLRAPYYFVTAWGGAPILEEESLPVYSYYAYPTWIDDPAPSDAFLFRDKHAQPVQEPTHRVQHYPFLMAEQQGGIQVRYNNRPVVPARSTEAMTLVNLGSGCNGLGYYMYHGGTTPQGWSERLHPIVSYDFQAPVGEFGQVRESYRALKLLHLFLESYGDLLAPMETRLPSGASSLAPGDVTTPRYCVRTDGEAGFLFCNNFQDHAEMQVMADVSFELETADGALNIPDGSKLTIPADTCFILPFRQTLSGARLRYATAQPLTRVRAPGYTHYFYFAPEGIAPEFCFESGSISQVEGDLVHCETRGDATFIQPQVGRTCCFTLVTSTGERLVITTLTRQEAEDTWKGNAWGSDRVIVSRAPVTFEQGGVQVNPLDDAAPELLVFPPLSTPVRAQGALVRAQACEHSTCLQLDFPVQRVEPNIQDCGKGKYEIHFSPDARRGVDDIFLRIDYDGDTGMAFLDGELIADDFCNGIPWEIGLKRFFPRLATQPLVLVLRPLQRGVMKNVSSTNAARFEFHGDTKLIVHSIRALPQYAARLTPE